MFNLSKVRSSVLRTIRGRLPTPPPTPIRFIAGDIVNQCNLRCPFCLVDYANIGSLQLMTRETFDRCLELLPICPSGGFWLSCLHEPTLHPQFIEFIEAIPAMYRDRISFTTNLARRLTDDTIQRLANSGVHQIRVSYDSLKPDVFAVLRKKAKLEVFDDNLSRLSAALRASKARPQLHFITMILKDNMGEVVELLQQGRRLGADSHEFRYPYYVPSLAKWGRDHFLTADEWKRVEQDLKPYKSRDVQIAGPQGPILEACVEAHGVAEYVAAETAFGGADDASGHQPPDPIGVGSAFPPESLALRLRWDGLMESTTVPGEGFRVNVKTLDAPVEYFQALRRAADRKAS